MLLGVRALAVTTVSVAALAFAAVAAREWGPAARCLAAAWPSSGSGCLISSAFPFALGVALALLALWAPQTGHRWRFAALTLLTLGASPVARVPLAVVLRGVALARRRTPRNTVVPALVLIAALAIESVLLRLFPAPALTRSRPPRRGQHGVLRRVFAVYAVTILTVYLVPSGLGENVARRRYIAVPIALLVVGLRRWRPLPPMLAVVGLALAWNVTPLAADLIHYESDATARVSSWRAPLAYLHAHLQPGYRVEAVDTIEHWGFYLAESGIPLVRGWFRQDDFPQNALLYRKVSRAIPSERLRGIGSPRECSTSARSVQPFLGTRTSKLTLDTWPSSLATSASRGRAV